MGEERDSKGATISVLGGALGLVGQRNGVVTPLRCEARFAVLSKPRRIPDWKIRRYVDCGADRRTMNYASGFTRNISNYFQ